MLNPIPCARDPPVLGGCSQDSGPGAQIPSCPAATGWMEGLCPGAGTRLFGPLNPSRQLQLLGQPGLRVWDPRLRAGAAAAAQEPQAVLEELPDGTCGATSERRECGRQRILPCSRGLRCTTLIPSLASIAARRFRLRLPQALSHRAWERGRKAGWSPVRPRMHLLPESRLNHTPALRPRHSPGGRAAAPAAHSPPRHGTQRGTVQHGDSLLRASRTQTSSAHRPPHDTVQLLGLPPEPRLCPLPSLLHAER